MVLTIYSAMITNIAGTLTSQTAKSRILTNWPNIDPQAGIQAYSTFRTIALAGDSQLTVPQLGPEQFPLIDPVERFIPIFDPRPGTSNMDILQLEIANNIGVGTDWSFEAWGYWWDRSVMQAPGGLRHPGSN